MSTIRPPRLLLSLALLALAPTAAPSEPGPAARPAPIEHRQPPLSSAYERMLRDRVARGEALPAHVIRRWGLDVPEPGSALEPGEQPAPGLRPLGATGTFGLATDVLVNDRSGDASCSPCFPSPLGQAETTIAALGADLLAGWNDAKGFCGGAVQGYGYSVDGGATWLDVGEVPALPSGGRWRGDPVHAVNRKTGDFYIAGLYEGGVPGSGLAILRGHFAGGAFVVDLNRQIAVGGPDFLDKEWLACDSLSGNLYVTYSNFKGGTSSQIELIRSTDNGLTWSAPVVLSSPAAFGSVQSSRPIAGPDGEVYVVWDEYGTPDHFLRIRRSDDFAVTFGPEQTVAVIRENDWSGAPGFRRGLGFTLPGIAVDLSGGPHRGRVYVSWDEGVRFTDAPLSAASIVPEAESNGFFAAATLFALGQGVRGTAGAGDVDYYRFAGLRGQTIFCRADSTSPSINLDLRLVCAADTASFATIRSLAFSRGNRPGLGFTLPADGAYYLRVVNSSGSGLSTYRVLTAIDTPTAGDRALDHRDQFASWSDDGAAWSTPVRVNDSDPWLDGIYPEITVDGAGTVHAYWHDFRDDAGCGALSVEYMASSGDGGLTWGPNRAVSDALSFWSTNACGSANQGDYQGIASEGTTVYPCWTDSRLGDPDVFMERTALARAVACAPPDTTGEGAGTVLEFQIQNAGNVPQHFAWSVAETNGWLTSVTPAPSGDAVLPAAGTQVVQAHVTPAAGCSPAATDTVRLVFSDLSIPGRADTCTALVTCLPAGVAVGPGPGAAVLALEGARPNPAGGEWGVAFTLAAAAPARLELVSASGRRVLAREVGSLGPGRHVVSLAAAGRVAPGIYLLRLTQSGKTVTAKATVLP